MIPLTWKCPNCETRIFAQQTDEIIVLIDMHKCGRI
jgi:RNA polymerase subunit RPABC4/transcription elongation factor Spt4